MISHARLSDYQRMVIQIQTLYRCNPDGRLRCVNEPGPEAICPPAPRFFLGRTSSGNCWRFRHDLPAAIVTHLERLCRSEPITDDLARPPQNYAAIKAVLEAEAPIASEYRGPAYWMPENVQAPTNAILITDANAALLQPLFPWLLTHEYHTVGPVAAVVEQGRAVAVCFCARLPGQATEAGVETHEAFRGRGYATAVVARWAAAVRQQGCLPLYSTDWTNLASQGIARKLRMVMYGEDWSLG